MSPDPFAGSQIASLWVFTIAPFGDRAARPISIDYHRTSRSLHTERGETTDYRRKGARRMSLPSDQVLGLKCGIITQ